VLAPLSLLNAIGHGIPLQKVRKSVKKKVNVGLGFMTGRRSFKSLLRTYVDGWNESQRLEPAPHVALHLFVAYDLMYTNTQVADYAVTDDEVVRTVTSAHYVTGPSMRTEAQGLVKRKILTSREAKILFGGQGYSAKRNAILYLAVKQELDYLIFLDDDEYPLAPIRIDDRDFWTGQAVIANHLKYLPEADITNGHHCGYVSPIPQFQWNDQLSKDDFRLFIEAISNDILNWGSIEKLMGSGGVTYASRSMLETTQAEEVLETGGTKFISGSNLGLSLKPCSRLRPFWSPPGARGEDAFLSTCLSDRTVLRIPVYVFHDGFSQHLHLLRGVLPASLKAVRSHDAYAARRFLRACVGWIRYKPMLTYVTHRDGYEAEIANAQERLATAVPRLCAYFGNDDFSRIPLELERYHRLVEGHFRDFEDAKLAWAKVMVHLADA
jgi:hypothetical protein